MPSCYGQEREKTVSGGTSPCSISLMGTFMEEMVITSLQLLGGALVVVMSFSLPLNSHPFP